MCYHSSSGYNTAIIVYWWCCMFKLYLLYCTSLTVYNTPYVQAHVYSWKIFLSKQVITENVHFWPVARQFAVYILTGFSLNHWLIRPQPFVEPPASNRTSCPPPLDFLASTGHGRPASSGLEIEVGSHLLLGSWLTLIPPSGGLYGSQFLVMKLLKIHKCYEYETIIYSSSFFMIFHNIFSKLMVNLLFFPFFLLQNFKSLKVWSLCTHGG